ncbi:oxygenase MpaB family protein [Tsukamurella sp. 8F]|uniref:oxygenase MpaB family protein n=1 Tax=unclassified Tsukamurella TaxID=2633480 RepID=UPI0023B9296C|nr:MULTISPECIES: oxygenase MpaB family protein [unclassified Tsukamurella]MDF0531970.1 oxygenase MpaB family protein [Tsukamurella sp. 8J]MDF0588869.1 oxygenase MpaB family protein [Tsukamurella sp. 8F]
MTATTALPTRHPVEPCTVPAGIRSFAAMLRLRPPSDAEFRRLGEALIEGDQPMDRLVQWMHAEDTETRRAWFEQALLGGIASVAEAPPELREFFEQVELVPAWLDREKLRVGARAMRAGGADGLYLARDVSLLGGYLYSGFNVTLLRTGALEKGSNQRFAETTRWALDVISEGGLEPGGIGYRSTIRVRWIHSMVRRHLLAQPDWDTAAWGIPINQTDMAATLIGALVAPSIGGIGMGIFHRPAEYEAVAHLTRYVGRLMGVSDEFLPRDFRDCVRILFHTSAALATPDETSRQLASPMAEDPLRWNYPRFAALRRRLAREQHLSISCAFLGRRAMALLGLPTSTLPWYPVLRFPVNAMRSALRAVPALADRAADRGIAEQDAFMRTMVDDVAIGHSASVTH